jgi:hypothetical protein
MKRPTAKRIKPAGRNPVIAVRVPESLQKRIKDAAKRSGKSMSEEMAWLLARGFEWQDAFGDRKKMLKEAEVSINQLTLENVEAKLPLFNFKPIHDHRYSGRVWTRGGQLPDSPEGGAVDPAQTAAGSMQHEAKLNPQLESALELMIERAVEKVLERAGLLKPRGKLE